MSRLPPACGLQSCSCLNVHFEDHFLKKWDEPSSLTAEPCFGVSGKVYGQESDTVALLPSHYWVDSG